MHYKNVGHSGLVSSSLAFGTMSFGGDADEATSAALYARCRDRGVTVFDCADVYNGGRSEEILGRLVACHRHDVVVTSKAFFPTGDGPNDRSSSRYHLVRAVEGSLRRLNTDRIDVLFLHKYDESTPLDESLRALEHLTAAGKVCYVGLSNFAAWQMMKALGVADRIGAARAICTQPMYNLVKRQAEVEILPACASEGLGVFPYSPLAGGLLSGKYGAGGQGRLTSNAMYQKRYEASHYHAAAAELGAIASELGVGAPALAIAWVASHPAVTAPILGARNLEQLDACLAAADVVVDEALRARLSALVPTPPLATDRAEEAAGMSYGKTLRKA
ncbi:MAG: aldo/keto reductase [Myxococcales bacterium]|nr:aldo/keto reductase [Myxococcales bacterium]MCB9520690.1 aldo/keto reductase [Myxococcales bacterium]